MRREGDGQYIREPASIYRLNGRRGKREGKQKQEGLKGSYPQRQETERMRKFWKAGEYKLKGMENILEKRPVFMECMEGTTRKERGIDENLTTATRN